MKISTISKLVLVTGVLVGGMVFAGIATAQEPVDWSYEGDTGPEHWGELSPDFASCTTGREQSPVDIPATTPVNPADIVFNYRPSALTILNDGHTVQVDYGAGSSIEVDGKSYNLLQFHFHALSEHTIDGNHFPLEMHLVHQSDDGEFAVIGVMINRGDENPAFTPVWNYLPPQETEAATISGVVVNVNDLLPAERTYYRYDGSLTIPPCTEGVKWFVLSTSLEMSDGQVSAFEQIYQANYRPIQSLEARSFLTTSGLASETSEPAPEISEPASETSEPVAESSEPASGTSESAPEISEPAPETLPVTGEVLFPRVGVLMGLGIVAIGAGLYLKYFNIV